MQTNQPQASLLHLEQRRLNISNITLALALATDPAVHARLWGMLVQEMAAPLNQEQAHV